MDGVEKLRKEFKYWKYSPYFYQKRNYYESEWKDSYRILVDSFMLSSSTFENALSKSLWKMKLSPVGDAVPCSFKDLENMTLKFSRSQCLIHTMYGRLFADHEGNVAIKTWDFFVPQFPCYADHPNRFCNELEILTREDRHPCLMKLKGFCFQHILALVYDEMPTQVLSTKLHSGNQFGWNARMRVATQLASLFAWFHERRYAFGTVRPKDIMIDNDFNIKVFDFGFLTPVTNEDNWGPLPYHAIREPPEARYGIQNLKADVYIFGILLVELIGNSYIGIEKKMAIHHWILKELQGGKRSIVNESILQDNDELANGITDLAVKCLNEDPNERPNMMEVSTNLSNLVGVT
ncbi:wall-associated receptor kinase-like 3 isoform X2 [Solanum stenotomum]|uniref:wall-associated receptor kinase-like 3 isoform X2 n=1 Tax=Solanum stenotomum TaxID=172797 RepID=UPI0020D0B4E1|nr:wall-associated receptor kinase-like 3 isoform X2 [Solanum stenotomum]